MRKIISLVLLLALVGFVMADVSPARKLSRPLVTLPQESANQLSPVANLARVILRFFAPPYAPVVVRYSAPPQVVPIPPPVCNIVCVRMPIQSIAQ